jgi:hypothetical protein
MRCSAPEMVAPKKQLSMLFRFIEWDMFCGDFEIQIFQLTPSLITSNSPKHPYYNESFKALMDTYFVNA